jgi:erythromycin esterase
MTAYRNGRALVVMVLFSLTSASAAAPVDDAAAIAWLRAKAVPFSDTEPSVTELQTLIGRLGEAQIIGIGEATHGDHQDQSFKAQLIKAMIASGRIDTIALECSRQAGADFDAFARTGQGDLTMLIRSKRFFRTWQDDEMAGLILWVRAWNSVAATPVRIIGIDNQDANRDIAAALDFIRAQDSGLADRLAAGVAPMLDQKGQTLSFYKWVVSTPQAQFDQATAGVQAIQTAFAAHRADWQSVPGFGDAEYAARVAAQGLKEYDREAGNPDIDFKTLPADYENRRDLFMAENLVANSRGGHPTAVWAHDLHIVADVDPAQKAAGWQTMGSELRRQLGANYVAIGFAWTTGRFNSRGVGKFTGSAIDGTEWLPQTLPNDRAGDLGYSLSKAGLPRFWIDLRDVPEAVMPWATTPMFRGWAGATVNPATWQTLPDDRLALVPGFDLLVYFHTITPSHLWKKLPGP